MINQSLNRSRLAARLAHIDGDIVIALQGGASKSQYDTDTDLLFRQESNFWWATGVNEPDCLALLRFNSADESKSEFIIFAPDLYGGDYAMWCGEPTSLDEYKQRTGANEALLISEFQRVLASWNPTKLYTTTPSTSDVIASSTKCILPELAIDTRTLLPELVHLRLRKTPAEIEVMRIASRIASEAHIKAMKAARPGVNERELDAVIVAHSLANGCKKMAYMSIVAGGNRGAVLHYVANNKVVNDGDLVLIDAGCEYELFASDITRVFPVNGKFTAAQKEIYQIVLDAHNAVIGAMRPGVDWTDLHRLAERIITEGLLKADIIRGTLDAALANHIGNIFFPHGLGHSLGLDTHDPPNRDGSFEAINEPGIKYLRCRPILEPGMVLTVEPGVYFIERILDAALADPQQAAFLNREKIDSLRNFGGVRIEDDVVVTETGCDSMTKVPKEIADIEALMAAHH